MIFALIPAAGHSRRMGRPKLSLRIGEETVLDLVLRALREGGVEKSLVVLGPHVAELESIVTRNESDALVLPESTPDMRATVEAGLSWIQDRSTPDESDQWFLVPADHPTIQPEVIRELLIAQQESKNASILIPTHRGKRGHPTLLSWSHVSGIREHDPDQGINSYIRSSSESVSEVEMTRPSVLDDLDTPEDYERLLTEMLKGRSP